MEAAVSCCPYMCEFLFILQKTGLSYVHHHQQNELLMRLQSAISLPVLSDTDVAEHHRRHRLRTNGNAVWATGFADDLQVITVKS